MMEDKITNIITTITSIKSLGKLDEYVDCLSEELKTNEDIKQSIKKRRSRIKEFLRRIDPNNCGRCGMELGRDEYDRPICYMCRF